jgi:hypothetical protein
MSGLLYLFSALLNKRSIDPSSQIALCAISRLFDRTAIPSHHLVMESRQP